MGHGLTLQPGRRKLITAAGTSAVSKSMNSSTHFPPVDLRFAERAKSLSDDASFIEIARSPAEVISGELYEYVNR
jgi:hypothetical protein